MQEIRRVLLVDDEPLLCATLQAVLSRGGYPTDRRESATEAFQALCSDVYGLLILDLSLPDADGMCLLAMVHRMLPNLPVLILTANDSNDTTLHAYRLGVKGYLIKPIKPEQILYCVKEIMLGLRRKHRLAGKIRPNRIRRAVFEEIDFTE